jgi:hypothetical protein
MGVWYHIQGNMHSRLYISFLLLAALILTPTACAKSTPVRTVQTYLAMLSGEKPVTDKILDSITTECYRKSRHQEIASSKEWALDRAQTLRQDTAIREFLTKIQFTTQYDVIHQNETDSEVVARVIITELHPGDREKAIAIPNLPAPLVEILKKGLELPFQFKLRMEENKWKIDDFTIPDSLIPLFEPLTVETANK